MATYIAIDSFGTATNVTGDGAIALVMDRIAGDRIAGHGGLEADAGARAEDAHA